VLPSAVLTNRLPLVQASLQVQDVSDAPIGSSCDDPEGSLAMAKEYSYPVALPNGRSQSELAALVSALRYIILHEVVTTDFGPIGSGDTAGSSSKGPGAECLEGLVGEALQSLKSSPLKFKRMLSGEYPSSSQPIKNQQHSSYVKAFASGADSGRIRAGPLGAEYACTTAYTSSTSGNARREHLAGGEYGDGPLWAACVMLHLLGQHHAWKRMDICQLLSHWHRYNSIRPSSPPPVGLEDPDLTEEEQQAIRAMQRSAHQQHMDWLARLAAAEARAQYAWSLATTAMAARFAEQGSSHRGVALQAHNMPEPLLCKPNLSNMDALQADQCPIRPAPKGAHLPATLLRQSMGTLPTGTGAGPVMPGRPGFAPAKAGLVSSALSAEQVARFRSMVPPSQAYSCSGLRDDTNASVKTCSTTNYFKGAVSMYDCLHQLQNASSKASPRPAAVLQ
jgi:hypothetical protein